MGSWGCVEGTELKAIVEKRSVEPKSRHIKEVEDPERIMLVF